MNFAAARRNMIDSQIRVAKVRDERLIEAMAAIPRERFLPPERRALAYVDEDVAIGHGRYLMEPAVLARLMQEAAVEPKDVALVVGAASGYAAAVMARLASTVVALESEPELVRRAEAVLRELAIDNVVTVQGALLNGAPQQGPFQVIFLDGAVDEVPPALSGQLADGGRLVCVVQVEGIGRGTILTRTGAAVSRREFLDAAIHALPERFGQPGFVF